MRLAAAVLVALVLPAVAWAQPRPPAARYVGRTVNAVDMLIEGRPVDDPALRDLIETQVGRPLSMVEVRESIAHLFSLGRFQDVQVDAEEVGGGVRLRFNFIPMHAVQRVEFRGELGLSEGLLRRTVTERFGPTPQAGRIADVVRTLDRLYRDRGYLMAVIRPVTEVRHDPDRTVLTFQIEHGPRARIGRAEVVGAPLESGPALLKRIGATPGEFYEPVAIQGRLSDYIDSLKKKGRYEAVASLRPEAPSADGSTVDVNVEVQPGPIVTIEFDGDPLPSDKLKDLVPVEREGSADEDLLEDSSQRIEQFLRQEGYWKAGAPFTRKRADDRLTILFTIRRGLLYRIANGLEIRGNRGIPTETLLPLVQRLRANDPYVSSNLAAAAGAIAALYRQQGYPQVKIEAAENELNSVRPGEGLVNPVIVISEGPRTLVGDITFAGNDSVTAGELRSVLRLAKGDPYFEQNVALDREAVLSRYLNLGFASAEVNVKPELADEGHRADLRFFILEGAQTLVDHIIIVGNTRTDPQVIRRELLLRPGEPLGLEDRIASQRRLGALGLFRRVNVQALSHGEQDRQDVLVTVEESLPTSIGYGGGLEVSKLLRPTGTGGDAEERFEFAPRGFFDIGRRNLGGKNRSVNLYTRFSLRPDDEVDAGSRFGFVDYRIVATYRQPRLLGANEAAVTGALEQGVRSSFNFARKGVNAELNRRIGQGVRATGRYSFGTTRTFIKGAVEEDPEAIDRLFPQVRLSSFSGAVSRDTRDDLVEPSRGMFLSGEGSVAARALGGQVGFMKTYLQGFFFVRLPGSRGAVFAGRAALGLADGFQRSVQVTDSSGEPIPDQLVIVEDLPASERFFAGGDTTIRGFALDTVGEPSTISSTGFPKGGNAVTILNAELRLPVWGDFGAVVFVDGGNVFERVTRFDVGELRGSAGFGVRYRSPIGPVRLDLGFKMDRREGESRQAIHFSIGHAF
jgi:outer membrane protein assembly complex protein YaeT